MRTPQAGIVLTSGLAGATLVAAVGGSPVSQAAAREQAHPEPGALRLTAPHQVATGVSIPVHGFGAPPGARVRIDLVRGRNSAPRVATLRADRRGRFRLRYRPTRRQRLYRFRAVAGEARSELRAVRARHVTLAAVGDINLGDRVGRVMAERGYEYPWGDVAPALHSADVAFGNLECAVSNRGRPVPKEFRFRGRPAALRTMRRFAGFDVLNLANNHIGDYGRTAMRDTFRHVRRYGMLGVGAGVSSTGAAAPRVIERLGLRIAFVGFSDIGPASFFAGPSRPGTQQATDAAIQRGVRAAARRADVVVATFHWGVERAHRENARQRGFAKAAFDAGATAVIGAHPHVLQPVRHFGRRLVAYSLGNFVWSAGSAATASTGILELSLSARGVERSRLRRARIVNTRPRLR